MILLFNKENEPNETEKSAIVDFLYTHLEEYGDSKSAISKCMDYALSKDGKPGGFILCSKDETNINGVVIVNRTGMSEYIPENILVYIATHNKYRGKGIGKKLMEKTIAAAHGDIALHVEANNPAKKLYEKFGFTNPYLEMRLKKAH